jgi:hypothetical protein
LNSQLEKLKIELDETVSNPNSNMRDLTKIACSIDQEIEELYISKVSQEEIEKLLNTDQAMVIILNIKSDLLEHYYNISLEELEILAQNIYDYCCLMVNEIPRQEIISYITMKSGKYYDELSEESRAKMTIEFNIKFFKHLISKYKKIIKSNKKS